MAPQGTCGEKAILPAKRRVGPWVKMLRGRLEVLLSEISIFLVRDRGQQIQRKNVMDAPGTAGARRGSKRVADTVPEGAGSSSARTNSTSRVTVADDTVFWTDTDDDDTSDDDADDEGDVEQEVEEDEEGENEEEEDEDDDDDDDDGDIANARGGAGVVRGATVRMFTLGSYPSPLPKAPSGSAAARSKPGAEPSTTGSSDVNETGGPGRADAGVGGSITATLRGALSSSDDSDTSDDGDDHTDNEKNEDGSDANAGGDSQDDATCRPQRAPPPETPKSSVRRRTSTSPSPTRPDPPGPQSTRMRAPQIIPWHGQGSLLFFILLRPFTFACTLQAQQATERPHPSSAPAALRSSNLSADSDSSNPSTPMSQTVDRSAEPASAGSSTSLQCCLLTIDGSIVSRCSNRTEPSKQSRDVSGVFGVYEVAGEAIEAVRGLWDTNRPNALKALPVCWSHYMFGLTRPSHTDPAGEFMAGNAQAESRKCGMCERIWYEQTYRVLTTCWARAPHPPSRSVPSEISRSRLALRSIPVHTWAYPRPRPSSRTRSQFYRGPCRVTLQRPHAGRPRPRRRRPVSPDLHRGDSEERSSVPGDDGVQGGRALPVPCVHGQDSPDSQDERQCYSRERKAVHVRAQKRPRRSPEQGGSARAS